jgi:predicted lipase
MNELIEEWANVKEELAKLQNKERDLRLQIAPEVLQDKLEGSKTVVIDGWKLSATAVLNYNVDEEELELRKNELTQRDWEALRYKPTVNTTKFRKLDNDSALHRIVTAKPGMPQLKIVEYLGE